MPFKLTPSAFLPTMIDSKPQLFHKVTPVKPSGEVTVVDLGREMSQDVPVARHSSLPPSPTRAEYDHNSRAVRHGSLPPFEKLPKFKFPSPVEHSIEETEDEMDSSDDSESVRVTGPPTRNSKTLRVHVEPAVKVS